jgi:abhydrolase domain-containing protein 13
MARLYDLATSSAARRWKLFPGGDHNSTVLEDGYFEAIEDFVGECVESSAKEGI